MEYVDPRKWYTVEMANADLLKARKPSRIHANKSTIKWQEVVTRSKGRSKGVWQLKGFG